MSDAPARCRKVEVLLAALLFLLLALGFLARGLPSGRAPVSVDPLYTDAGAVPFAPVRPPGFRPHNPYLSDQALVFYPWLRFMSAAVRGGEMPLWSPHSGGGVPFIGNLSSAFFFPTTWLCFLPPDILSVGRGMLLGAILRLWLAGFFGYLFLRRIGLSRSAAVAGGVGFMLFGYQVVWLFYSLSNVACMIPLCLYLAQRFAEKPAAGRGMVLAVALAVQFLGGHAETSLALGIAVTTWFLAVASGGSSPLPFSRMLLRFGLVGFLALAFCSYQLLPFVEYLRLSHGRFLRLSSRPPTFAAISPASIWGAFLVVVALVFLLSAYGRLRTGLDRARVWRPGLLAGFLVLLAVPPLLRLGLRPHLLLAFEPNLYGNPLLADGYRGPETYTDMNGGYVGAFALLLALLYLLAGARRRVAVPFGLLLLFAWVLPAHVEPFSALLKAIPPFDLAANTRMLPLAGVAISVLAACTVSEIGGGAGARYRKALGLLLVCALVPGVVAGGLFLVGKLTPESRERYAVSPTNGISLLSPAGGEVFAPAPTGRGNSRLLVPISVEVPPGTRQVRVRAGAGAAVTAQVPPDVAASGGRIDATWDATRSEAGRYHLALEITGTDDTAVAGPEAVIIIDRKPRLTGRGLVRIAAAVLLVVLLILGVARIPWLVLFAPVAIGAELFLFGFDYNVYVPERTVYPPTGITDFLAKERSRALAAGEGPFRVLGENVILQANMHYAYGLETVRSYDQLENRNFNGLMAWVAPNTNFFSYNHRTVDYAGPLFPLLDVRYIVSGESLCHQETLREVFREANGRVYENLRVMPRATVVGDAANLDGMSPMEKLAYIPVASTTALLEQPPPVPPGGTGSARIVTYRLNEVDVDVTSDGPAMLLLTDNWFPGWRAYVNDKQEEIYRSHLTFRAVPVPAGDSRVEFRYRPFPFWLGVVLAAVALAAALIALLRSRSAPASEPAQE